MATFKPFAGIRPQAAMAEKVASPPYDVVSSEEAREIAEGNPYSFLHINKPEIDFPASVESHSALVYQKGGENLQRFLRDSILAQDSQPAFYLYRQTSLNNTLQHSQTGFVGLVSADDYESNVIKKHELTRPEKEDDRVRHMQALAAQTGPVFLTYRGGDEVLARLLEDCSKQSPVYDFISEEVQHQFWTLTDAQSIAEISSGFQNIPALFVADGHHRSAAAVRYRSLCKEQNKNHSGSEGYNFFMAVLFPHEQLNILGYHRVVRDLGQYDCQSFLQALGEEFELSPSLNRGVPERAGQFGMYVDGSWYSLAVRDQESISAEIVSSLDVSILQDRLLSPLLGITDPRKDQRIDFVGGIRGQVALERAVDSGQFAVAFACYPVSIEDLLDVADQGKLMPPKSTWFEPKLKSGLVIHAPESSKVE